MSQGGILEAEVAERSRETSPDLAAVSMSRKQSDNQNLVSFMECPICFDVSLPILQCKNGHIICNLCWNGLPPIKLCPSCRVSCVEPTRNLALEKILQGCGVQLQCKFWTNGCIEKMAYINKEAHQASCRFKTYACPMASCCRWEGLMDDIVVHLKGRNRPCHSVPALYGESATFYFKTDTLAAGDFTALAVQIQVCFGCHFIVAFKTRICSTEDDEDSEPGACGCEYNAVVQFVGQKEDASHYAYRMELQCNRRRLSWEAEPLAMSDSINEAVAKGDCLSFGEKTMKIFKADDIEFIPIDVTICKKTDE